MKPRLSPFSLSLTIQRVGVSYYFYLRTGRLSRLRTPFLRPDSRFYAQVPGTTGVGTDSENRTGPGTKK